jgi:hypothetical protein
MALATHTYIAPGIYKSFPSKEKKKNKMYKHCGNEISSNYCPTTASWHAETLGGILMDSHFSLLCTFKLNSLRSFDLSYITFHPPLNSSNLRKTHHYDTLVFVMGVLWRVREDLLGFGS